MRFLRRILTVSIIAAVFSGCAYFNMYFNAKQTYNEAERKRLDNNTIDKAMYENTIKELSKILEFYPESRWVDDALLMMGLSFLRQSEFYQAQRKFNELLLKFPDSPLSDRAKIHLAETEIALGNYDEARNIILSIQSEKINIPEHDLLKLNAEMNLATGDSLKALELFISASEKTASKAEQIQYYERVADLAIEIRKYSVSAEYYRKILGLQTERQGIFEMTLKYAESLANSGRLDEAVKVMEKITADADFVNFSLRSNLALTKYYLESGDAPMVKEKVDGILKNNPKDRQNGPLLSQAAFYLGEVYFIFDRDFKTAEAMYDSSGFFDRRNEFYQKGLKRLNVIREAKALKKNIVQYEEQKDRLRNTIDSLGTKLATDDLDEKDQEPVKRELENSNANLLSIRSSNVSDTKKLADILFFELGTKDSALTYYEKLSEESDFPHIASLAMLRLTAADSSRHSGLEDSLLTLYPNTESANYIRLKRGMEPVFFVADSAAYLYNIASQKFLDSLYHEAVEEYRQIAQRFEENPLSPRILRAAGLIAENYLNDYSKAIEIYTVIADKYPNTEYSRFAGRKIAGEGAVIEKEEIRKEIVPDSDRWYMMDRRNN